MEETHSLKKACTFLRETRLHRLHIFFHTSMGRSQEEEDQRIYRTTSPMFCGSDDTVRKLEALTIHEGAGNTLKLLFHMIM